MADDKEPVAWELEVRSFQGDLVITHTFLEEPELDGDVPGHLRYQADGVEIVLPAGQLVHKLTEKG